MFCNTPPKPVAIVAVTVAMASVALSTNSPMSPAKSLILPKNPPTLGKDASLSLVTFAFAWSTFTPVVLSTLPKTSSGFVVVFNPGIPDINLVTASAAPAALGSCVTFPISVSSWADAIPLAADVIDDAFAVAFEIPPSIPSAILVGLPPPAIFKLSLGKDNFKAGAPVKSPNIV